MEIVCLSCCCEDPEWETDPLDFGCSQLADVASAKADGVAFTICLCCHTAFPQDSLSRLDPDGPECLPELLPYSPQALRNTLLSFFHKASSGRKFPEKTVRI